MTPGEPFRVGDWLVHPSLNRLVRGEETAALQPRFMDLLAYLAQRPGKVVSKEEILEAVWAKEFVSEGTLTHAVAVIRQTLGDDVRNPRYIETIPVRGYRLIAPVAPPETAAAGGSAPAPAEGEPRPEPAGVSSGWTRRSRLAVLAASIVAVAVVALLVLHWLANRRSGPEGSGGRIVVLPFQNLGPVERDYLAQGITDDITTRLGGAHGVAVVSRTTAAYCAKTARSAPQIAEELGVNYILEGTVRWESDRPEGTELRVNAQLIRAANDTLIWGDSYRVQLARVVDVGATIAGRVVQELGVTVRGPEQTRLAARPTNNSDAYQAFLCGMRYRDLESREQLGLAIAMFERAVTLDPSFALAYAELSLAQSRMYSLGIDPSPGQVTGAERAAERALALRPDLPEAHLALGAVQHLVKRDFERALDEYRLSKRELASDSEISTLIADIHRRQGRWSEARSELESTVDRDPANYGAVLALGDTLASSRAFAEADRAYQRASNLSPDRIDPYVREFWNYLRWDGRSDRAERVLDEAPLQDHPAVLYCRSYLAYVKRDFREAVAALGRIGDDLPPLPFRLPSKDVLECLYLDAAGDRAGVTRSCGAALRALEPEVKQNPSEPWPRLGLALAEALLGRGEQAVREADRAAEVCPLSTDAYDGAYCLLERSEILARAGENARALDAVERLLAMPSPLSVGWLRMDPQWDRLRRDPRFEALLSSTPVPTS